jgi:hypothetical protein
VILTRFFRSSFVALYVNISPFENPTTMATSYIIVNKFRRVKMAGRRREIQTVKEHLQRQVRACFFEKSSVNQQAWPNLIGITETCRHGFLVLPGIMHPCPSMIE